MNEDERIEQLKIDGGADQYDLVAGISSRQLSDAQAEIIAFVRTHSVIRTVQAGKIMHAHRGTGCNSGPTNGIACCKYAGADGLQAIERLVDRQILKRVGQGLYALQTDEDRASAG